MKSPIHEDIIEQVGSGHVYGSAFIKDILKISIAGYGTGPLTIGDPRQMKPVRVSKFYSYINTLHYGYNLSGLKSLKEIPNNRLLAGFWPYEHNVDLYVRSSRMAL